MGRELMAQLTHRPARGNLIQGFGPRPKPTPTSPAIHYGQDYGWGGGDQVYAAADGDVVGYAYSGAYGNRLIIQHDGFQTWSCHLDSALVTIGQEVLAGAQVAIMGATGNVTAKHLHFEVRVHGVATDPAPFFTLATTLAGTAVTPPLNLDKDPSMKLIQVPSGTIALVGEFTAHAYPSASQGNAFSYGVNGKTYGIQSVTQDEASTLIGEARARRAGLIADIASTVLSALPVASGGSGQAIDLDAIVQAVNDDAAARMSA